MSVNKLHLKKASTDEIRPLRHKVLRPHQDFKETLYPGDNSSPTFHLKATLNHEIVGIISFYPEDREGKFNNKCWRLRGMAVDPRLQKQGIGTKLLEQGLKEVTKLGGQQVWCNARVSALEFYGKNGFYVQGEEFEIPGIGPHFIFQIDLKN